MADGRHGRQNYLRFWYDFWDIWDISRAGVRAKTLTNNRKTVVPNTEGGSHSCPTQTRRNQRPAPPAPRPAPHSLHATQRDTVLSGAAVTRVLAGPGSGKTRCLAARIAVLLGRGASPGSILAVTFANAAARDMRVRFRRADACTGAAHVAGEAASPPPGVLQRHRVGTFHAVCMHFLNAYEGLRDNRSLDR